MTDVQILRATADDLPAMAKLSYQVGKMHDEALPDYFSPTSEAEYLVILQKMLADERTVLLKAVMNGKVCGFLSMALYDTQRKGMVHSKVGYIHNFGVDEKYRGQGIGSKLLLTAETFFKEQGAEVMDLNVFKFNDKALKFYLKHGYQEIDITLRKVIV